VLSLETVRWDKFAALHDPQRCTGCSLCAVVCPFRAITMRAATDAQGVCTAPGASADSAGGGRPDGFPAQRDLARVER
jgi:Fe-S-cluster-containing hydrogenase component 2